MKSRACMTEKSGYLVKRCDGTDLTWKNSFHPHSHVVMELILRGKIPFIRILS